MTDAPELKPCPFCGGKAFFVKFIPRYDDAYVRCERCEIEGERFANDNEKAIAAWNTRADQKEKK